MPGVRALLREVLIGAVLGIAAASVVAVEGSLHIWQRPSATLFAAGPEWIPADSTWQPARLLADDGVPLDAWLLTPGRPNGAVVTLLHGVADSRLGMLGHADFLLRAGYAVLVPDARGHGASGGTVIGYGVREVSDLRLWSDWLCRQHPDWRQYGLGVSMGAAILLQSLAGPTRHRAVVAESSFATFEEIAGDRLSQVSGLPRAVFWPVVQLGFLYARCRYGIDLRKASPVDAVRAARIPILLIHGARDSNIPMRHSLELQSANPRAARLWVVPEAGHAECLSVAGPDYQRRVLAWFGQ